MTKNLQHPGNPAQEKLQQREKYLYEESQINWDEMFKELPKGSRFQRFVCIPKDIIIGCLKRDYGFYLEEETEKRFAGTYKFGVVENMHFAYVNHLVKKNYMLKSYKGLNMNCHQ